MKWNLRLACYHLSLGFLLTVAGAASAAELEWQYPLIREYGKVLPLPDSALQPDPNREARIVVNVTKPMASAGEVNPGLDRVARLVNLLPFQKYRVRK
jgi:hypothetical protein